VDTADNLLHWILIGSASAAVAFFCVGLTSYFERRPEGPAWVRRIHWAGGLLSLMQLVGVALVRPRSDNLAIAAIVMYTLTIALWLSAIESANRTRLQRSFVDYPLPDRLLTHGPYRWVRHPFCLGYIVGAIAPIVATGHPFFLIIGLAMTAIVVAAAVREERVWLASPRADEYRAYRRRTGMFVPFIG
jgi:protein-S-isoprenylcysteine O-methyltransferase Ste14